MSSNPAFRDIDVHSLLLQQEPFVAVGQLTYCDDSTAVSETEVQADSVFVCDGMLTTMGIVENMAQTASLHFGYRNVYILHREVGVGLLAAIRSLHIHRRPRVGERLTTRVEVEESVFGLVLMRAQIHVNEDLIAEGLLKFGDKETSF